MTMPKVERAGESLYQGGDVECSKCYATFAPVVYEVSEQSGVLVAFNCPECKHVFTVAHIDKSGLEIRAQLAAVGRQTPEASMNVINERVRTVRRLKQELKRHVRR